MSRMTMTLRVWCPTSCDDDCEQLCHEVHQVYWRRAHQPEDCITAQFQPQAYGDCDTRVEALPVRPSVPSEDET